MVDDALDAGTSGAHRDVKAELDERRIAKGVAIGLPLLTVTAGLVTGVTLGAPMAILVLAAGILLGVIALFWASLRVLSGDAALPPELEALDATAHAVDALASRRKMLIRALKDLDNERALGKLEDIDYEQLSHTYRGELKEVLARIDASLAPHRPKAEEAVREYLGRAALAEKTPRAEPAGEAADDEVEDEDSAPAKPSTAARLECAKCSTSNEPDATFCKKCGASLAKDEAKAVANDSEKGDDERDDKSDAKNEAEAVDEA